jgi:hypothetical protein
VLDARRETDQRRRLASRLIVVVTDPLRKPTLHEFDPTIGIADAPTTRSPNSPRRVASRRMILADSCDHARYGMSLTKCVGSTGQ